MEFPQVSFSLWNGSGDDVLDRLHHGLADLALIAAPYNTELLDGFPVAHEPWTAFMSINHPVAQRSGDVLPLKELVGQPLFIPSRRSRIEGIRAWFREIGEEPLIAGELSSHIDAVALAEQNVGICIYPMTTYNDSNLVSKKVIVDSERQIEYVLVWNRNQLQKELAQEFVNFVKDCLEEEQKGRRAPSTISSRKRNTFLLKERRSCKMPCQIPTGKRRTAFDQSDTALFVPSVLRYVFQISSVTTLMSSRLSTTMITGLTILEPSLIASPEPM